MTIRTQLKAGKRFSNHNEALQVRTALNAGRAGGAPNHNEALQVRTALKAGARGWGTNHNEKLERAADRQAVSMRRDLLTNSRKEDRLELLVVRAGLRAGRRRSRGRARE